MEYSPLVVHCLNAKPGHGLAKPRVTFRVSWVVWGAVSWALIAAIVWALR